MHVDKGAYILLMTLEGERSIGVGRLGELLFPAGYYLYSGSALGGLRNRVRRHLRKDKKLRWHIDYLIQHAHVVEVWYTLTGHNIECRLCVTAACLPQAEVPVPGFGSSDCRCLSHLIYYSSQPSFKLFRDTFRTMDDCELLRITELSPAAGIKFGHY